MRWGVSWKEPVPCSVKMSLSIDASMRDFLCRGEILLSGRGLVDILDLDLENMIMIMIECFNCKYIRSRTYEAALLLLALRLGLLDEEGVIDEEDPSGVEGTFGVNKDEKAEGPLNDTINPTANRAPIRII